MRVTTLGHRKQHSMPTSNVDERPEDLLTPLAYALSLAPPRAPPFDSAHRALLIGQDPSRSRYHLHHHQRTGGRYQSGNKKNDSVNNSSTWIVRRLNRAHVERCRHGKHQHPHLLHSRDRFTLWLDKNISVLTWNNLRDNGTFRSVADSLVLLGVPAMAVTSPRAALQFIALSRQVQRISYGPNAMHVIDLFTRPNSKQLVVFVHGGAWGSGTPWMYRLVAQGFTENVAVIGYRTYPDADVPGQVQDLSLALQKLQTIFSAITQFTIIGHSSGAHIGLIHVIQEAKKSMEDLSQPPYHTFVGLSGPYDLAHHYDFEAARGVEELSPLKAAGGLSLEALHSNSPAHELHHFLLECEPIQAYMPPSILLVHGMEDTTVPFTATAEMARRLVACGLAPQQLYLAKTGHQDTVLQMMLGGLTYQKVIAWLASHPSSSRISAAAGMRSRL